MSAIKQPEEASYYGYEFSALLGANTIASIQSVDFYAESGRGGTLTDNGEAIVGTQVRVLWGGGSAGTRYITTVTVTDSTGAPLQVSGEICVGPNCGTCDPCWPVDICRCYSKPCVCPPGDGTQISVYGGPLKRAIIMRAYGMCGQSVAEFELSPEDFTAGLQALNDQMAILGPLTGYNFPDYGDGTPEEESGLRNEDVLGASYYVAQLLAPTIGKDLKHNKVAERACSIFLSRCTCLPEMQFARQTIIGAGNRWRRQWGPFFPIHRHDRGRC